jgi:Glycosyltransferase Family 4
MQNTDRQLPRLLYIGDVPIERSFHGSILLYRLLEDYPSSRLVIIEGNLFASLANRRLVDVQYHQIAIANPSIYHTRFRCLVSPWLLGIARYRARKIPDLLGDFQPDAILTVACGYSWLTAYEFALMNNLPLHLIVHDDLSNKNSSPLGRWVNSQFGEVYRHAKTRLCVSPYMSEEYEKLYGVTGSVLYPSRGKDTKKYTPELDAIQANHKPLTVVFGGTINHYSPQLQIIANELQKIGGKLIIYGPLTPESAISLRLTADNIRIGGLLPATDFVDIVRAEADILLVPMSFDIKDRANMERSFPSKLTEYTAMGLPILIYGPSYCSAVRWANENHGVAEVVSEEDPNRVLLALERLLSPEYRFLLAQNAVDKGDLFFSHTQSQVQFLSQLCRYNS